MLSKQIVQNTINELNEITYADYYVYDKECNFVASTTGQSVAEPGVLSGFMVAKVDDQIINGCYYTRVAEEDVIEYIVIAQGSDIDLAVAAKVAVSQLKNLLIAYKSKVSIDVFLHDLIMSEEIGASVYNMATKLHFDMDKERVLYIIEIKACNNTIVLEILKNLYVTSSGYLLTVIDTEHIALLKEMDDEDDAELREIAESVNDVINTEAMVSVRVAYGEKVRATKLHKALEEAMSSLEIGRIFYTGKTVLSYKELGIGKLIYHMPEEMCRTYVSEILGGVDIKDIDEDTLEIVNCFFDNNLNISETSRQMYRNRNALSSRLEKLEEQTGLDMRKFHDAVAFEIAILSANFIEYLENFKK